MFVMDGEDDASTSAPTQQMPSAPVTHDHGHDNRVFADEQGMPHLARPMPKAHPQFIQTSENSQL